MPTTRKPRRIRVATCPYCGYLFRMQRKTPGDDLNVQICPHCYMAHQRDGIPSTLENRSDFSHLK